VYGYSSYRKLAVGYEPRRLNTRLQRNRFSKMTGSTGAAFNDPTKGSELPKSQFSKGEMLYCCRWGYRIGVYQLRKMK